LWIQQPDALALGPEEQGELRGFGAMGLCVSGWKVGPLFPDSRAHAQELLMTFGQQAKGQAMYMDAPEDNPEPSNLCRSLGINEVFGCVRMYRGAIPNLVDHNITWVVSGIALTALEPSVGAQAAASILRTLI